METERKPADTRTYLVMAAIVAAVGLIVALVFWHAAFYSGTRAPRSQSPQAASQPIPSLLWPANGPFQAGFQLREPAPTSASQRLYPPMPSTLPTAKAIQPAAGTRPAAKPTQVGQ